MVTGLGVVRKMTSARWPWRNYWATAMPGNRWPPVPPPTITTLGSMASPLLGPGGGEGAKGAGPHAPSQINRSPPLFWPYRVTRVFPRLARRKSPGSWQGPSTRGHFQEKKQPKKLRQRSTLPPRGRS
jgi:hypothetical protein